MSKYKREIQECIFNIDSIFYDINNGILDMIELNVAIKPNLFNREVRLIFLQLCSILDEIKILNAIARHDPYLQETLTIISPILRALGKYKGIRGARNSYIAHLNRDNNGKFAPFYKKLLNSKMPRTKENLAPIITSIYTINQLLLSRYKNEWEEIRSIEKIDEDKYKLWMKNEIKSIDQKDPFEGVFLKVQKNLEDKNIKLITQGLPFKDFDLK